MNKFVVGSNVDVALQDGHPTVNGSRLDHLTPDDFYKDRAGHEYIDFEQEFAKLNVAANDLATITPAKTYTAADFPDMNNRTIDLTDLSDPGFLLVNIDAEVLTMNTPLQIINPNDQVVVFNVINSSSALNVQSPIKYNDRSNHETEDFSDANISWNFGNEMTDLTISAPFQGTILAPNATIRITQNQDGTIIGTNVILDAATNRWDPNEIFISDNGTDTTDTSDSTDTSTTSDSSDSSTSSDSTDTTSTTSDSTDTSASSDSTDTTSTTSDSTDTSASSDSTDTTSTTSDSTDTSASSDSTDTTSTTSDSTDTSASSDSTDTTSTTSDSTDTSASSDSTDTISTTSDSSDSSTSSDSTDTSSTTSDTRHASVSFSKTSSDNRTNFNLTNKTSNDNGNKSKRALPKTGSQSNNWITLAGVILLVIGLRITFMSYKKSKR